MGKNIRERNEGFSLIELIVAVLILGIISGAAIVSFKSVYDAKVDSATKIVGSVMKQAREKAMALTLDNKVTVSGRSDVFAVFHYDETSKKYVGEVYETTHTWSKNGAGADVDTPSYNKLISEEFGSDAIDIVFTNKDTSGTTKSSKDLKASGNYFQIFYKKSTGGVAGMYYADSATDISTDVLAEYDSGFANSLEIKGSGGTKKLIIVPATGRCYYDE